VTTAAVTALDEARASLAGGIVYMFQIAGGSIGLGLTTTVFTSSSQDELAAAVHRAGAALSAAEQRDVSQILSGTGNAKHVVAGLDPGVAGKVTAGVRDAFITGFQDAFLVDGLIALAGCAVAVFFVGGGVSALITRRAAAPPAPSSAES
jgi:hypothetical protein